MWFFFLYSFTKCIKVSLSVITNSSVVKYAIRYIYIFLVNSAESYILFISIISISIWEKSKNMKCILYFFTLWSYSKEKKNALYQIMTFSAPCQLWIMLQSLIFYKEKKFSPKTIFITGKLINNSLQKKPVCYFYIYTGSKDWFDMNQT